jgi:predicted deacetylase
MGQDQSGPIVDENVRPQTLDSRTIEAVAKLIKDGRVKKIVVMVNSMRIQDYNRLLTRYYRRAQASVHRQAYQISAHQTPVSIRISRV